MSMYRLELVPAHNENAGRSFPLTLGRCELAQWWWKACPHCRRTGGVRRRRSRSHSRSNHRRPSPTCQSCRTIASSAVKLLSKKMFYVTPTGSMIVLSSYIKNTKLLWYNDKPLLPVLDNDNVDQRRQQYSSIFNDTTILLQPGDTLSIGYSSTDSWMTFHVHRVPNLVTPEKTNNWTKCRKRQRQRDATSLWNHKRVASRRRLRYNNALRESSSSGSSSISSQSTDSTRRNCQETQGDGNEVTLLSTQRMMSSADHSKQEDGSACVIEQAQESTKDVPRRMRKMSPRRLIVEPATSTKAERRPKDSQQRMLHPSNSEDDDESDETSLLSLPKCPTWEEEEDEEDDHVEDNEEGHDQTREWLIHGVAQSDDSQHSSQLSQDELIRRQEQEDSSSSSASPNVVLASTLSLEDWKCLREQELFHQDNDFSRVRRALASLVIARKTQDSTWFPTILEGAVVDGAELPISKKI